MSNPSDTPARPRPGRVDAAALRDAMSGKRKKTPPPGMSVEEFERKQKLNAEGGGYSGASKEWAKKFDELSNTEYWLAFCFRTAETKQAFLDATGVTPSPNYGDGNYLNGHTLARRLDIPIDDADATTPQAIRARLKDKAVRLKTDREELRKRLSYQPHPDPLATLPEKTGTLEEDIAEELALLKTTIDRQDPDWYATHGRTIDSPHYLTVIFDHQRTKDLFLALTGLGQLNDKYLDGHLAARILGYQIDPQ